MIDLNDGHETQPQLDPETASHVLEWTTAKLNVLTEQLEQLDERMHALQEEIRRLTTLREQLEWAVGSHPDASHPGPYRSTDTTMPPGIAEQSRVDAVLTILEESEGPLSPADIRDRLHERGRDDEYRLVSSSLDYLRRSRRAHRVGRGAWIAGPEASDDASAATQGVDD